eukprot:Ihof_evm11s70 gene=Ihof_evmTU11s70
MPQSDLFSTGDKPEDIKTIQQLQVKLKHAQERIQILEEQVKDTQSEGPIESHLRDLLDVTQSNGHAGLTPDELIDVFVTMCEEANLAARGRRAEPVEKFLTKYSSFATLLKEKRMNKMTFEHVKVIGKGTFATVQLVRHKETGKPYVLKRMSKQELMEKTQYAFHDSTDLFLVLNFYAGGDLLSLLGKHDVFSEDMARFYMTEMVISIDTVHRMGYIHRDIKIDNFLLDALGHLYLTDFGSTIKMNANGKATDYITGGTPDYIAPELLGLMQGDRTSLEFVETKQPVSQAARDLITGLIADQDTRLGTNGVGEIMTHPFFESIDWDTVRKGSKVPFKPNLVGQFDTMLFDDFDEEEEEAQLKESSTTVLPRRNTSRMHTEEYRFGSLLPFVGYSYSYKGAGAISGEGTAFIEEMVRTTYKQRRRDKEQQEKQSKEKEVTKEEVPEDEESKSKLQFCDQFLWFDAANNNELSILKALLAKGTVEVNSTNRQGATALHLVCMCGGAESSYFLVANGADVNAMSASCNTPLHWAIIEEQPDIALHLLAHGARIDIVNEGGQSAYDLVEASCDDYEVDPVLKA